MYRNFTSLDKLIPQYFTIIDAIVNGLAFLIYLSNSLLLLYRNTKYFCLFILYFTILLNLFIISNIFREVFLGNTYMSPATETIFILSY